MFNLQRVKDIAEKCNISQKELCERAGIKVSTFYALKNPTSTTIESIANILHCSIDEFFDREIEAESYIAIGHQVKGNGNKVSGNISLSECQKELEHFKTLLVEKEKIINEKERTIQILMNK